MGQTKYFGYNSDAEYRQAIAAEIAAQEAQARESKPLYASEMARDSAGPDDLILQATDKLMQALTSHQSDLGVNQAWGVLGQMLEGSTDPESAAFAVIAFASEHPDYAVHGIQAMQDTWGDYGSEVLEQIAQQAVYVEAVQEQEEMREVISTHIAERADLVGGLSDQIAHRDGEVVRGTTAILAGEDEGLFFGNDTEATARIMGHRAVALEAEASVAKQSFLAAFDREAENFGPGKGTDAQRDMEGFRRDLAAATEQATDIDPEAAFERGYADGMRRTSQEVTGFPFNEEEWEQESRKYERPEHSTPEAIAARDKREEAEEIRRFGEPSRPMGS